MNNPSPVAAAHRAGGKPRTDASGRVEQRIERFIQAATEVFLEKGYRNARLNDVVARIAGAAKDALADAQVRERLATLSLEPYEMGPAQFAEYLDKEYAEYSKVIDEVGIKV